jgi:hypothetical protein
MVPVLLKKRITSLLERSAYQVPSSVGCIFVGLGSGWAIVAGAKDRHSNKVEHSIFFIFLLMLLNS